MEKTENSQKKLVVSLGHDALGLTTEEQKAAVRRTARYLADLMDAGCQLTITHSNGPQVSMIHKAMTELHRIYIDYTPAPMSVCSAMSQGYVGYDIQNSLKAELIDRGNSTPVSTILTQVSVDPYDEAFYAPTKKIGRYMSKEDADNEVKKGNFVVEEPGKGWLRVVATPKPLEILELDAIRLLADSGQAVICCGGGGIPVIIQDGNLQGASAVIEKDDIAGKLASDLHADMLLILTSVPYVYLNYDPTMEAMDNGKLTGETVSGSSGAAQTVPTSIGTFVSSDSINSHSSSKDRNSDSISKEKNRPIASMTVEQAKNYIEEGQFGPTDMLPKINAAITYLAANPNGRVVITTAANAVAALEGKAGTIITQ